MRRCCLLLFVTILLLSLISGTEARAAGLLIPRDGSTPIVVRSHRVDAEMYDGLARTTLRQTFVNPGVRAVEGIYVFPLPEGAALVSVAMETGGRRFEGLLVERQKARRIYDSIVREKRDPALVEEIGRNLFRLSVFPVLPKVDTVVELTWITRVPLERNRYRYVYPLSGTVGDAQTEQDFTFSLKIRSSLPLGHIEARAEVEILRKGAKEVVATVEKMRVRLDRDVVVSAEVAAERPSLTISTYRGEEQDGWFLATITPPVELTEDPLPRDVFLLLDASGSMRGEKMRQARAAALHLLGELHPVDRVNIIRYGSYAESFSREPLPATPENLKKLREFVENLRPRGGTALAEALGLARSAPGLRNRNRVVILLTDGLATVGETGAVKIAALARSGARKGYRLFCIGLGYDVDASLLATVSRAGRGRSRVVREGEDIETRLSGFLDRTSSPAVTDVKLSVFGLEVFDLLPCPVPDAYPGEQVVLCGRYRGGGEHVAAVTAKVGGEVQSFATKARFLDAPGGTGAIAWLYARERLDHLESLLRLRSGLSEEEWYAVLEEGGYETADAVVSEILAISREYGVQSAYASFVVLLPEDRRRLDPRNLKALAAALEKARKARAAIAPAADAPRMSMSEIAEKTKQAPGVEDGASGGGAGTATPPGPSGGRLGGGSGGGVGRRRDPSANWMRWWAMNREEILGIDKGLPGGVAEEVIEERVVPALLTILDDRTVDGQLRQAAVIALARCPDAGKHFDRIARLVDREFEKDDQVRGCAALALGLLPDSERERALAVLRGLLSGRRFQPTVESGAALAAGLLGDRSRETSRRLRFMASEGNWEPACSALFAIGLIGDEAQVPHLLHWLDRDKVGRWHYVRAWFGRAGLMDALGRIGDPRALPLLEKVLGEKSPEFRREAAIALGRITSIAGPRTRLRMVRLLIRHLEREPDDRTRQQGLLALGRIAAASAGDTKLFTLTTSFLEERFQKGDRATDRPYAALGLGLAGRSLPADRKSWKKRAAKRLRSELVRRKGNKVVLGALAVALGMLGDEDPESIRVLIEITLDRSLPGAIRVGAVAGLGTIGSPEGLNAVREVLVPYGDSSVFTEAAQVLSHHGDEKAASILRGMMQAKDIGFFERSRIMRALGRYRDPKSLDGLLEVLGLEQKDPSYRLKDRAAAVQALGHLVDQRGLGRMRMVFLGCDESRLPWSLSDFRELVD